jgi:hypothetical protein
MISSGIDKPKFRKSLFTKDCNRVGKNLLPQEVQFTSRADRVYPVKIIYKRPFIKKLYNKPTK